MNSLFKIGDDSINLMPHPIQTILQDPQDDDKVDETIVLFTPETSPIYDNDNIMTMSQPDPSNALSLVQEDQLSDMVQYPNDRMDDQIDEILGDETFERDFSPAIILDDDDEMEQPRAITQAPVSPDSDVIQAAENSATIDRHVSQIAEQKADDQTWESFITDDAQRQFLPQNVSQPRFSNRADQSSVQMQIVPLQVQPYAPPMINSCKIKFYNDAVFERNSRKLDSAKFVFVNTMDAKRENQRTTRFGVAMESDAMDRVPLDQLRLAVWLSLPGVYNRLTTCPSHANRVLLKYNHDDFMKVTFMNQEVTAQIAPSTVPALDNHPSLWEMPLPKNNDADAIELAFFCFSSCLKKGNAKEKLQLNVAILDKVNNVIARDQQLIRVTANPHRDAGVWPESAGGAKNGNSKQPRKQAKRAIPLKRQVSDDEYLPRAIGFGKRIKREPPASPPAYIELHEHNEVASANASFNRLVDMAPVHKQDEVRAQLLRMHSSERNNFIAQEESRIWANLETSLKYHHQRP
jgi:hypothetical protein